MAAVSATAPAVRRPRSALVLKRMLDICGAVLLLVLLSPLMAVLALAIKLQDRGPVLYRRRVIGGGGEFDALKFRTMRVDADVILRSDAELRRQFEENYKLKDDPRITPLGRSLRKYSLDELPQLFNVLRGQMSLVGPRMITSSELSKYGDFQALLLSVKPGMTGYWQVNGRQSVGYDERVRMDAFYISHWSLAFDLKLLLQTPGKVVKGDGAY
ncbi:MAG: sugar transferase [Terriglobales bacterium]